jgi:hypothetical protein
MRGLGRMGVDMMGRLLRIRAPLSLGSNFLSEADTKCPRFGEKPIGDLICLLQIKNNDPHVTLLTA